MKRFEALLDATSGSSAAREEWRSALALVADTAFICRAWLSEQAPDFTPADLVQMTAAVMAQERDLVRRKEREQDKEEARERRVVRIRARKEG